ncbi:hypothetical protein N182_10730 [Sinorhizobium sp. GL2]|nr:hypothetical protein N182_10730 [Sinorhizobium sp. GL2]
MVLLNASMAIIEIAKAEAFICDAVVPAFGIPL